MVFGYMVVRVRSRWSTLSAASQDGRQGIRRRHWTKASLPCPAASNRRTPSLSKSMPFPDRWDPFLASLMTLNGV
jgi:hypothetical protein